LKLFEQIVVLTVELFTSGLAGGTLVDVARGRIPFRFSRLADGKVAQRLLARAGWLSHDSTTEFSSHRIIRSPGTAAIRGGPTA
jgi:hypothetical protein